MSHFQLPGIIQFPNQNPRQGGLPFTILSHKGYFFSPFNHHIHSVQHLDIAKMFLQAKGFHHNGS